MSYVLAGFVCDFVPLLSRTSQSHCVENTLTVHVHLFTYVNAICNEANYSLFAVVMNTMSCRKELS